MINGFSQMVISEKQYNKAVELINSVHQLDPNSETGDGIDVSQLTPGYYIVIAENSSATYIGRFVKE